MRAEQNTERGPFAWRPPRQRRVENGFRWRRRELEAYSLTHRVYCSESHGNIKRRHSLSSQSHSTSIISAASYFITRRLVGRRHKGDAVKQLMRYRAQPKISKVKILCRHPFATTKHPMCAPLSAAANDGLACNFVRTFRCARILWPASSLFFATRGKVNLPAVRDEKMNLLCRRCTRSWQLRCCGGRRTKISSK